VKDMNSVLEKVVECIEQISQLASLNEDGKEILSGFRSRAESMPSIFFIHGFAYTMVLLAARSSRELMELGFKNSCKEIVDEIKKIREKYRKDELSYGLYGATILLLLHEAGNIKTKEFSSVLKEAIKDPTIDLKAMQIFEWIKRLAEAYIAK